MAYLKLIRYKNLLIVLLTQVLMQYLILTPALEATGKVPVLNGFHFALLCLVTVIITASGFIINDFFDQEIDRVNKPDELIIGPRIPPELAKKMYHVLNIIGGILALWLSVEIGKPFWFLIYPVAVFGLWLYSKFLKKLFLWGNFVVAAFCGGVSLVLLLPELDQYFQTKSLSPESPVRLGFLIIAFYSLFAFLTTFLREVVMDLEDMEGDQANHRRTLPLISGVGNTKIVAVVTGFLIIALSAVIWFASSVIGGNIPAIIIFSIFNLLLLLSIYKIFKAEIKQHYGTISTQIKVLMLLGLLFAFTL